MQLEQASTGGGAALARLTTRGWAWLLALLFGIYALLPWLSPLLRQLGFERAGRALLLAYASFCHQLPERSFTWYGYQVCYCHRCTALYTSLAVFSAVYALGRWRVALPTFAMLTLVLPMAVDALWHGIDDVVAATLRSPDASVGSLNFWLRIVTGVLCAAGVVLWAYPRLQSRINDER